MQIWKAGKKLSFPYCASWSPGVRSCTSHRHRWGAGLNLGPTLLKDLASGPFLAVPFLTGQKTLKGRGCATQSLTPLPTPRTCSRNSGPLKTLPIQLQAHLHRLGGASSLDLASLGELSNHFCTPGLRSGQRLLFLEWIWTETELGGWCIQTCSAALCMGWSQGWKEKVSRGHTPWPVIFWHWILRSRGIKFKPSLPVYLKVNLLKLDSRTNLDYQLVGLIYHFSIFRHTGSHAFIGTLALGPTDVRGVPSSQQGPQQEGRPGRFTAWPAPSLKSYSCLRGFPKGNNFKRCC